jgi:cold shock CspA family protein
MADSWNKREREKKKQQSKKEKEERKRERKDQAKSGPGNMIAYIDEFGNIVSTPPDPSTRTEIKAEEIEVSVPKQKPMEEEDPIREGTLTFFNQSRGFGFIRDHITQESIFVHINDMKKLLSENTKVRFEVRMDVKGAHAINVEPI